MRERVERMASDLYLVNREDFDAVRAMATKARAGQEELEARVAKLEAELAVLQQPPPPPSGPGRPRPPQRQASQKQPKTPLG